MEEKILKDETLNVEELEKVAGGTRSESDEDLAAFVKHGIGRTYQYYSGHEEVQMEIFQLWKRLGVDCQPYTRYSNEYFYKGRQITRKQALCILESFDPE